MEPASRSTGQRKRRAASAQVYEANRDARELTAEIIARTGEGAAVAPGAPEGGRQGAPAVMQSKWKTPTGGING